MWGTSLILSKSRTGLESNCKSKVFSSSLVPCTYTSLDGVENSHGSRHDDNVCGDVFLTSIACTAQSSTSASRCDI